MSFARISFILLLSIAALPQVHSADSLMIPKREYIESEERLRYDDLLKTYGNNKILAEGYELQALIALSHFPELKDIAIEFVVRDARVPMAARPTMGSLLRGARSRKYQVISDTMMDERRSALLLKNQPFNAQIGILGHELAHIQYYLKRSFFGLVGDGICQLSDCRRVWERENDMRLIDHGLGWQRYDHASFVRNNINQELTNRNTAEGSIYMRPQEFIDVIDQHPLYIEVVDAI